MYTGFSKKFSDVADMALEEYRRKRDFKESEPPPGRIKARRNNCRISSRSTTPRAFIMTSGWS
jgi:hypothetical protein